MGSIVSSITGGVTGNAGGAGLNYQAGGANVLQPATTAQANDQYQQAQAALAQQQNFVNAVQAQNGLGNQSSVYNQLQGVANGQGPNPAQAQLAQATGANTANQAALMAGQRGAGANAGLIARQAAMQGGANQQNAAGQAATMQANQSLNALNQMGGLATNQANQQANAVQGYNQLAQGEQGQVLGAIGAQNNANVGMQSNQNSSNAGISMEAAKQQGNLIGNITGGIGSALGLAQGGQVPRYADGTPPGGVTQLQSAQPTPQSGPASRVGQYFHNQMNPPQGAQQPLTGTAQAGNTIGQGIGQAGKWLYNQFNSPSAQPYSSSGLPTEDANQAYTRQAYDSTASPEQQQVGQDRLQLQDQMQQAQDANEFSGAGQMAGADSLGGIGMAAKGGKVPALVSPGEVYLPPKKAKEVAKQGKDPIKEGNKVPGVPRYPGNDYRNDIVPAKLEEGGIVIPNSVMQSKNPSKEAAKFVAAHLAKNGKSLPKKAK